MDNCKHSCDNCKTDNDQISEVGKAELKNAVLVRIIIKLINVIIILIALLFATNLGWLIYESQFEDVSTTIEAEQEAADGGNNYVVGGDMIGEAESQSDGEISQTENGRE